MKILIYSLTVACLMPVSLACSESGAAAGDTADVRPARVAEAATRPPLSAEDEAFYRDVARSAWSYMEENYNASTGLVRATPDWDFATIWDIGAQIIAHHAALELGLIEEEEYQRRTARLLDTLERAELVRGHTFNRVYSVVNGQAGDGTRGATGWSATDLGRLLIGLRVLWVHQERHRPQIERIVQRTDMSQVVRNGYLHGQMPGSRGQPWTFQEGRVGYEQYAATGFDLWGIDVTPALDLKRNAQPREVLGVPLLADGRNLDRLLSEPFVLAGLEFGWNPEMRELAENMLRVQEARYRQTGQVTIVSEDAVAVPPNYFYYYCVLCSGREFVVELHTPGQTVEQPRWVSTKATFGWHALLPSDYTRTAMEYVQPAHDRRRGWASGVMEGSSRSTGTYNINTAAVLLEVAAFQLRGGRPLIER